MKIFAYYLPQFHCIPENDEWWGKGFTEWTNVKKATSLYKGHIQPKIPLNDNYYSLDDVNTLRWQEKLMSNYRVDGLIIYHYYFKGRKILEKPSEMLLNNKDINIPFFFCWANHDWFRSWQGSKELLLKQEYGDLKDWEDHFSYLLDFFKDPRYEKKDNKPLLMVFKTDFKEKNDIFEYFNKKCIENGFDGIFIIESNNSNTVSDEKNNNNYSKIIHFREPTVSLELYKNSPAFLPKRVLNKLLRSLGMLKVTKYDGNGLYKIMSKAENYKYSGIRGCFFEWDNTPRHSKRGYVITPVDKKHFFEYMNSVANDEYIFINAWNEWAEGMMLEPTKQNEYRYLEWIKEWRDSRNNENK